jgi:hypothetical protein
MSLLAALAVLGVAPVTCGGSPDCSETADQWQAYVDAPAMRACITSSDCIAVGGQPQEDPCNGYSTIGYCGAAVNAKAYENSPAFRLENSYAGTCSGHKAYDCGPAYAECIDGSCRVQTAGCFGGSRPDSASPALIDAPFTPLDASSETGGG